MAASDRRVIVDGLIGEGKTDEAVHELALLWVDDPSSASFIISRYKSIGPKLRLTPCKAAFERSFTLEPLIPVCRAAALVNGIELKVHLGQFNAYAQDILDAQSELYRFDPDVLVLAVLTSDVAPELWQGSHHGGSEIGAVSQRVAHHFDRLIEAFRSKSASNVIIHTLEQPPYPNKGVLDDQITESQMAAIRSINDEIRRAASKHKGVYALDYDGLVSRFGRLSWRDEIKWQVARMPIKSVFHCSLAQEWLKFLHPMTGKIAKVIAVDLDNTLWGGIIGEDGVGGIKLGNEFPGSAYRSLQAALLDLRDRGLLLAICSKNNFDDVTEVFEKHPEMLLKLKDFSAIRINWLEKSANLRAIAMDLNVGLDAIALIDDNPVERQQVHTQAPEVHVVDLPGDPLLYADAVLSFPAFQRLAISQEDRERSRYYTAQRQALELKSQSLTKEDFYRSLQQRVVIESVTNLTLGRTAQLTQKTNQFNLTSRRYTEQQIAQFLQASNRRTYTIRVIDRYADNGLVGAAFTQDLGDTCVIDTFLLSCRVISRGIETALLSHIVREARDRGIVFLRGTFIPTKKNHPAESFLGDHGFSPIETLPESSVWQLELQKADVSWPPWIHLADVEAVAQ